MANEYWRVSNPRPKKTKKKRITKKERMRLIRTSRKLHKAGIITRRVHSINIDKINVARFGKQQPLD